MLWSVSLIGILNLECAVRPPGNIDAAIPDVAVAIAIRPISVTSQDFVKFWGGKKFAFVLLEMIRNSQGFESFIRKLF
jgi:hypothetical protein